MLPAFCFHQQGETLDLVWPEEDDFVTLLIDYCKERDVRAVAMDADTRYRLKYGVMDLLNNDIRVIVVDPSYTPINDKRVLPLDIHRNLYTLAENYRCVCVGDIVYPLIKRGMIKEITAVAAPGRVAVYDVLNKLPGWSLTSKDVMELDLVRSVYHFSTNRS